MQPSRDEIKHWIEDILARSGETQSALARRAGVATTTLTRFMSEPAGPMLSLRTIAKVANAAGVQPLGVPDAPPRPAAPPGLAEAEAFPYTAESSGEYWLDRAITAMIAGRQAVDPWVLRTRALEAIGYRPGDIVIVDLSRRPQPREVVCAQHYGRDKTAARTVWRVYEPPYLVAAPLDPALGEALRRPLYVDGENVVVMGVVIGSLRATP